MLNDLNESFNFLFPNIVLLINMNSSKLCGLYGAICRKRFDLWKDNPCKLHHDKAPANT